MRHFIIITVLLINANSLFCQDICVSYFRQLSIAEFEHHQGNTDVAIERFEKANANYPSCTGAGSKLDFAKMYLRINEKEKAYIIITEEIKNGYDLDNLKYIGVYESDLGSYYSLLLQHKDSLQRIFYSNLDSEALFFVKDMIALDQGITHITNIPDTVKWDVRHQIFRLNIQKLADYTQERGIIGYKEIGHYYTLVSLILVHHRLDDDNDIQNVNRLIRDYTVAIKKGNASPGVIINLVDNMADIYDLNKPQIMGRYSDHQTNAFKKIRDISKVDSIR